MVPILYAAVWAYQREWSKVAVAVGAAAILWSPALLFDLSSYPTDGGAAIIALPLWVHAVTAAAMLALIPLAWRYRWAVASLAAMAALPRFHHYDATFLLTFRGGDD